MPKLLSQDTNPDVQDRAGILPWMQSCIRDRNGINYRVLENYQMNSTKRLSPLWRSMKEKSTVLIAVREGDATALQQLLPKKESTH